MRRTAGAGRRRAGINSRCLPAHTHVAGAWEGGIQVGALLRPPEGRGRGAGAHATAGATRERLRLWPPID